jgi:hypothetical protein
MKILFVLSATLIGFFIGVFYGAYTVPGDSGLAGPAIILGEGVIVAVIALIASLFINEKIQPAMRKKITISLFLVSLIPLGWMVHRYYTNRSAENDVPREVTPEERRTTVPVSYRFQGQASARGLGMAKPDFFTKKVLYLYSGPNLEKPVSDHTPTDSLVFAQTEHHQYTIIYAPPWFIPAHMKMDYEILYLKIISRSRDWLQVEVNSQTGLSVWIDANEVKVIYWPEFLLNVFSIENPDPKMNPLRVRPLPHAGIWQGGEFEWMAPIFINENWIKVALMDKDMKKVSEAWIKWHDEDQLLINYSLLS